MTKTTQPPAPGAFQYRNPTPTVDVIIEVEGGIVLIERRNPPLGWAFPGGFVDEGESLAAAARREALEETSLAVTLTEQFFCYSDPARDPRQHTLSVVFLGRATGQPVAADDAKHARIFAAAAPPSPLVFDHAQILSDYLHYRRTGERPPATR
jgi:8-oxo-dGTP diphosphatase